MRYTKAFSADSEEELNNAIVADGLARTKRSGVTVQTNTGQTLSLAQKVENLIGQTKVLYDRLDDIKKVQGVPQDVLDKINDNQIEITKNKDSVNQNHLDFNEFLKTHPTDTEMEAKLRILNDLITQLQTTQSNAQLLINQNADKLSQIKSYCIPSTFRRMYKVIQGDGPTLNVSSDLIIFNKSGQMITLEMTISEEAQGWEIVINNSDTYSFYIPSYTNNDDDPLRARLTAGGLDIQVHGSNPKIQIWCTTDNIKSIGIIEFRQIWTKGSIN